MVLAGQRHRLRPPTSPRPTHSRLPYGRPNETQSESPAPACSWCRPHCQDLDEAAEIHAGVRGLGEAFLDGATTHRSVTIRNLATDVTMAICSHGQSNGLRMGCVEPECARQIRLLIVVLVLRLELTVLPHLLQGERRHLHLRVQAELDARQ